MPLNMCGAASEGCSRHKYYNVCVFFGGIPLQVLKNWHLGNFQIVVTHAILEEYYETGAALSAKYPGINPTPQLDIIAVNSVLTFGVTLPEQICSDPDDDKFLSCALAAKAEVIVSGDSHLLQVDGYKGIKIIKPKPFLEIYG